MAFGGVSAKTSRGLREKRCFLLLEKLFLTVHLHSFSIEIFHKFAALGDYQSLNKIILLSKRTLGRTGFFGVLPVGCSMSVFDLY